tara:strand:+ start:191 stop:652 length:462 start_codon:yes stop_codon:yes gene_type:complete
MRTLKLYDIDDNLILSYKTDHKFHGSQLIEVEGTVILDKILVDYPALINGKFGIVTFNQPIETPLYNLNFVPQPFPLFVGGTQLFEHLMFNGPSYFNIGVDEYRPWMYIGNLITKKFIPELKSISPVYKYKKQDNNIWNGTDLQKLETLCKSL